VVARQVQRQRKGHVGIELDVANQPVDVQAERQGQAGEEDAFGEFGLDLHHRHRIRLTGRKVGGHPCRQLL